MLTSTMDSRLHGDRPLERQMRKDSSQAYDKHLMSKLGRPKTPVGSVEDSPPSRKPSLQSNKPTPLSNLTLTDRTLGPEPIFKVESPFSDSWTNSPGSGLMSPGLPLAPTRSPTYEGGRSGSSSIAMPSPGGKTEEMEMFGRRNTVPRIKRSDSSLSQAMSMMSTTSTPSTTTTSINDFGTVPGVGNYGSGVGTGLAARHGSRGSYDQSQYISEAEPEFGGLMSSNPSHHSKPTHQQLHLLSSPYSHPSAQSALQPQAPKPRRRSHQPSRSRSGMPPKRKAEDLPDDRSQGNPNSQRRTTNQQQTASQYPHTAQASYPTDPSLGLINGTYAPSAGLSLGDGATNSMDSHSHLSAGVVAHTNDQGEGRSSPSYLTNLSLDPSFRASNPPSHQALSSADAQATAAAAHDMATDNSSGLTKSNNAQLQASLHICDCCPKKPKKFDTLEELQ